jgi:hypothetical protein
MNENVKLSAIEDYLKSFLQECSIFYYSDGHKNHVFRVDAPDGDVKHLLRVSFEFIRDSSPEEIIKGFSNWDLIKSLEIAGKNEVIVTKSGIS